MGPSVGLTTDSWCPRSHYASSHKDDHKGKKLIKKLNVTQLRDKSVSEDDLTRELDYKLAELHLGQATIEEDWVVLRDKIHDTAFQLLGPTTRKNQDWFDENDAEKNRLHIIYQLDQSSAAKKTAFINIRRTVQTRLRKMQDSWLAAKAEKIQKYADTHDSNRFYDVLKEVNGPQSSSTSPLLNVDGTTLITDKPAILNRWAEHFSAVINRSADINAEAIARLPQVETNTDLDRPPSEEEVKKAIKQLSTGKAPCGDAIPADVYKHGGDTLLQKLTDLFCRMWDEEVIPQQLKDASIIRLYKKGNRQLCDNYRGISLLAIAGKILVRVLLNRLIVHLEHGLLPESQCGFRGGRVTVDMIFAARQLQEKCQEQYDDLFVTFIDLTKAFDTVCRDGLWQIIEKFGCPRKFTALVRQLHDGMRATVIDNDDTSDSFSVTNGVKQGCVLAPTLFSMVFAAMLHDASQDNDDGIQLKYKTDGGVFNLRRLKAKTKVTLRELLSTATLKRKCNSA